MKDNSGKIILALIAGASAGVIAGLLMAPESGEVTRGNLGTTAKKWGKDLDGSMRQLMAKLDSLNIPGLKSNSLSMKGDWNETKGKLRQRYGQLTDDDLQYVEGQEDQLYGRLQNALGMGIQEVKDMLAGL